MVNKGTKSLAANPFSLLANFYMPRRTKREVRTILDDLSFEVRDGNRLALIGPNGAGKTTLLRVLAGAISPTRGTILITGKVQALLNINQGFRGEATGLENIYLRGLSMGMSLTEIRERVAEIAEFSELGEAIYDPLQTYSAGMRARLAFSIATSRAPNILLMDEWIGAGDKFFLTKAQERLQAQVNVCRAMVIASHSTAIIRQICSHGLVMGSGRSLYFGKIDDALRFYEEMPVRTPSSRPQAAPNIAESKLVITRVFDAPRHQVWKAWTDSEQLTKWWVPRGLIARVVKLDLQPGGIVHYNLKSPQGLEAWWKIVYNEIIAPERLVFTFSFSDEEQRVTRNPFDRDWPLRTLSEAALDETANKTILTLRWSPLSATEWERQVFAAAHDSLRQRWTEMLDQLAEHLATADTLVARCQ
jgi:ABC-type polysaccharide/polyol phosphate transport system ATPase subunit/uncharacterized protein YndB with AHSA1/START domain